MFIQFVLLWWHGRSNFETGNGIFKLTDVLPCCQMFKDSSSSMGNSPILYQPIRRVSCFISEVLFTETVASSETKYSLRMNRSHTFKPCSSLLTSSLRTKLLVFARLWNVCFLFLTSSSLMVIFSSLERDYWKFSETLESFQRLWSVYFFFLVYFLASFRSPPMQVFIASW